MYSEKINPITGRFKSPPTEDVYCQFAMENYGGRLKTVFLLISLFYLILTIYDVIKIPASDFTELLLLFVFRIVIVLASFWCIYSLNQKNKPKYMRGMMVFLLTSAIMPVYYNHVMDSVGLPFSFESSIFLFIIYAITRGALLLIPFIYFFTTLIIQTFLFLLDSFEHHHIDVSAHMEHITIYFVVLAFVSFVSYNFNVMVRRNFYDRHILAGQLKKSNDKVHELNRIEGAFLAETTAQVIAHEVKNSIAVISTYAQMLMGDKKIKSNDKKVIQKIYDASIKSDEYIKEIRELSTGKLNIKNHNIKTLIDEASHLWQQSQVKYKSKVNINTIDLEFKTDGALLGGAIANVIRNGIEAKKNGIVNVNIFQKSNKLHIEISNNKKLNITNSKDMFSLLKNNKNKAGSTGIGLVFSRSVVEKLGGELKLSRKNNITVFTFIIELS